MTDLFDPLERPPRDGDEVEAALIECVHLWRRSPGGGAWPFAGDGPWHLVQGEAGDYDARGGDMAGEAPPPRVPLSREEVARRDWVSQWWGMIGAGDRDLVRDAIGQLAGGASRVGWRALTRRHCNRHGAPIGADGLARRYARALDALGKRLRGDDARRISAINGGFPQSVD